MFQVIFWSCHYITNHRIEISCWWNGNIVSLQTSPRCLFKGWFWTIMIPVNMPGCVSTWPVQQIMACLLVWYVQQVKILNEVNTENHIRFTTEWHANQIYDRKKSFANTDFKLDLNVLYPKSKRFRVPRSALNQVILPGVFDISFMLSTIYYPVIDLFLEWGNPLKSGPTSNRKLVTVCLT